MSINSVGNSFKNFPTHKPSTKITYPILTQQNDSVEISGEQKNSALKKVGLAVLAGVGLAVLTGLCFLKTKKIEPAKLKQLAEHIEFKKAESFEEAIEFGKKYLGIQEYRGFSAEDLDVLNWVNEGLVNTSNYQKGKVVIPDIIRYAEQDSDKISAYVCSYGKKFGNTLYINKNFIKNIDQRVSESIKSVDFHLEKYNINSIKGFIEKINKFKNKEYLSLNEKMQMLVDVEKIDTEMNGSMLRKFEELISNPEAKQKLANSGILKGDELQPFFNGASTVNINKLEEYDKRYLDILLKTLEHESGYKYLHQTTSPFKTIYHEMGHLQFKPIEGGTGNVEFFDRLKFWNNDARAMGTAYSVSNYAATSPSEFVAEAYAELVSGNKLSQKAQDLFDKYAII